MATTGIVRHLDELGRLAPGKVSQSAQEHMWYVASAQKSGDLFNGRE